MAATLSGLALSGWIKQRNDIYEGEFSGIFSPANSGFVSLGKRMESGRIPGINLHGAEMPISVRNPAIQISIPFIVRPDCSLAL